MSWIATWIENDHERVKEFSNEDEARYFQEAMETATGEECYVEPMDGMDIFPSEWELQSLVDDDYERQPELDDLHVPVISWPILEF